MILERKAEIKKTKDRSSVYIPKKIKTAIYSKEKNLPSLGISGYLITYASENLITYASENILQNTKENK